MNERRQERREIGTERGRETGVKERWSERGRREEGEREGQRGICLRVSSTSLLQGTTGSSWVLWVLRSPSAGATGEAD